MEIKKIVSIIGSNNKESVTNLIMSKLLNNIKNQNRIYECENICLGDYNIKYCEGCETCFEKGFCPVDKKDDFTIIRKILNSADIIFFASPVYVHNISGAMKVFFDRMAVSCHLLNYSGVLGFTLTTTYSNGQEKVEFYLKDLQRSMGIKNLNNYIFIKSKDSINEFIEDGIARFFKSIDLNYGYTDRYLEEKFKIYKKKYQKINKDYLLMDKINNYEFKYWNQKWISECKSFQEFAVKNKRMKL